MSADRIIYWIEIKRCTDRDWTRRDPAENLDDARVRLRRARDEFGITTLIRLTAYTPAVITETRGVNGIEPDDVDRPLIVNNR